MKVDDFCILEMMQKKFMEKWLILKYMNF